MTKRRVLIVAVLAIALALAAVGSFAVPVTDTTASNIVTTNGVSVELREWADAERSTPCDGSELLGAMPGITVTRIVEAENTGGAAAWIRARAERSFKLASGIRETPDPELIRFSTEPELWREGEDGWFYYTVPLEAGETSAPLFTELSFAPEMNDSYQDAQAIVHIVLQSVQTANNGDTVMEALGWPEYEEDTSFSETF